METKSKQFEMETMKSQSEAPKLIIPYILNTEKYNDQSFSEACVANETGTNWAVSLESNVVVQKEEIIVQFPAYKRRNQPNSAIYDPANELHVAIFNSDNRPPFYETGEGCIYFRPINSVWMDQLKKDKNTEWIEVKPRFQVQERDFSSRIKGKLIPQLPTYPKEETIQRNMTKQTTPRTPRKSSSPQDHKPSKEEMKKIFEKFFEKHCTIKKGPIEEIDLSMDDDDDVDA